MWTVLFLFVSTLAMACAQQHEKSAIQAALDANNFELAAQLAAQAAARGRRGNNGPMIATKSGDIELRVADGKRVIARIGDADVDIAGIASSASAYTDQAVAIAQAQLNEKINVSQHATLENLDALSVETAANLANLKASTAVDLSKLSAEITTGLEPVVDVLKAELARHASCTKKGMLFDKSADDCTYAKVITCGPLAVPKESKRVPEASCTSIFPLSCNLVCPAGFAARAGRDAAKITSQCGEDGQWSVIESHKMLTPECDDIDECSANEKVCSEGSSCVNTPGSYVCKCAYTVTESGGCQKYGKSSFKFNRASETETFVVPGNGVIKYNIEVWGSGGGASRYYSGGTGGYTTATFEIKSGTKLIVSIGGPGFGIGHGKQKTTTYIGQGGGLSGVFVNSVSQKNSLIIAGSGGGAGDNRARAGGSGGYAGTVGGYVHSSVASTMGRGATQTKGGDAGVLRHASWGPRGYAGGALAGGHGGEHGSGGGAGYFGGGGGSHYGGLCGCAGGGGSSYVEETSGFGNSVKYISGKNFKTAKGSPGEPKNLRNRGGATYGTVVLMTPIYD